ncbi:uncharacterized protein LOC131016382 [Salvia miltiorrhiza]|uniref:uncharacterized protein LOC131016382 n=1 Tax=Salvia miltiorrhiza TaxID=226208 RepID=UPI0025AD7604|nr:uncharacterized protein LOC131016382 [Salvia miltiorrhiza]
MASPSEFANPSLNDEDSPPEIANLSLNDKDSLTEIGAQILKAGANGDLEKLKEIKQSFGGNLKTFKLICDIYSDVSTGWRVLHLAASMGNLEVCEFLVEHIGTFVDVPSFSGETPMILAAKGQHVQVVEYLIRKTALIQVSDHKGFTALHYAALGDNMALMELLLKNDAPLEIDSVDGTPLQIAASRGNVEAVKLLLEHGAEPNSITSVVASSPLIGAIKSRSLECMECLLEAKADPERFTYGLTPLAYAAKEADTKFLKCLLDAGASADIRSTGNNKPIEDAALADNLEAVEILFPVTKPIDEYKKWTVDGIMKYNRSAISKKKREEHRIRYVEILENLGETAMSKDDYVAAAEWYSEATFMDPSNPKWLSIRSMCYSRTGNGVQALRDAREAMKLNPHVCPCPRPHYKVKNDGADVWQLFKRYHLATIHFILAPREEKNRDAFRVALFEYFSLLYMSSCSAEMMIFFQHFM